MVSEPFPWQSGIFFFNYGEFEEKYLASTFTFNSENLSEKFAEKKIVSLISPRKNTQFKKKSSKSESGWRRYH